MNGNVVPAAWVGLLGLSDAEILLYVGRLAGNKRVPLLVEALAHLPAHVPATPGPRASGMMLISVVTG